MRLPTILHTLLPVLYVLIELAVASPTQNNGKGKGYVVMDKKNHDRVSDFQAEANRRGRKCAEIYEEHLDMLNEEFPYPYNEYYQMDKAEMVEVLFECLGYVMALLGVAPAREALPGEIIVDLQRHVTREYAICVLDKHKNEDGTTMTPEQCARKAKRGGFEPDTESYLFEEDQAQRTSPSNRIKEALHNALDRWGHVWNSAIHRDDKSKSMSSPAPAPGLPGGFTRPLPPVLGY